MTLAQIKSNIVQRDQELQDIKNKSDTVLQQFLEDMHKDYQQLLILEVSANTKEERKFIREYRELLIQQQKAIKTYQKFRYEKLVKKGQPPTPILKNAIAAFLVGGTICSIGQVILNFYKFSGIVEKQASIATAATMVLIGAVLTGLGIYDEIGKIGGAGSMVPITGFANSIVSPALEFKREGYVYGVGAKVFTIAGPVLLYGSLVSAIIGLIYYFLV